MKLHPLASIFMIFVVSSAFSLATSNADEGIVRATSLEPKVFGVDPQPVKTIRKSRFGICKLTDDEIPRVFNGTYLMCSSYGKPRNVGFLMALLIGQARLESDKVERLRKTVWERAMQDRVVVIDELVDLARLYGEVHDERFSKRDDLCASLICKLLNREKLVPSSQLSEFLTPFRQVVLERDRVKIQQFRKYWAAGNFDKAFERVYFLMDDSLVDFPSLRNELIEAGDYPKMQRMRDEYQAASFAISEWEKSSYMPPGLEPFQKDFDKLNGFRHEMGNGEYLKSFHTMKDLVGSSFKDYSDLKRGLRNINDAVSHKYLSQELALRTKLLTTWLAEEYSGGIRSGESSVPTREPVFDSKLENKTLSDEPKVVSDQESSLETPKLKTPWTAWHRIVSESLILRFQELAKKAFESARPMHAVTCKIQFVVSREREISNVCVIEKSSNIVFNSLCTMIVKSMSGNPILEFPSESKQQSIGCSQVFSWSGYGLRDPIGPTEDQRIREMLRRRSSSKGQRSE